MKTMVRQFQEFKNGWMAKGITEFAASRTEADRRKTIEAIRDRAWVFAVWSGLPEAEQYAGHMDMILKNHYGEIA